MTSLPKVLLVGGAQLPLIREAVERRGYRAVTINFPAAIDRLEANQLIEHAEPMDFSQPLAAARRIVDLHRRWNFATIVPVVEYGLQAAAIAAHRLGFPSVSLRAIQNTRDKYRMRRVLQEVGLGQVRFAACRSLEEGKNFLREVGNSIIVKPAAGTGSDGVSLVHDVEELARAFELAAAARVFGGVICEEFVPGPEISVEGYCVEGRFIPVAVTDKLTNARFLETGHNQPSAQAPEVQRAAFEFTAKVLSALDVTIGATHTELKLTPRGPVLIETHTRMGGDSIPVLTKFTTGVDLADITVGMSLGERPLVLPQPTSKGAAIRFLTEGVGCVRSVQIPPITPDMGIETVNVRVRPGDVVGDRSASLDRLGYVIAVSRNAAGAGELAEQFLSKIQIVLAARVD